MNCPRCRTELIVRHHGEAEIHACDACSGMFLDHGELNKIAEPTSGDLEYSTVHMESFEHPDAFEATTCPHCPDFEMSKVEFNIHTGIILDYCSRCRGFWLDGTELGRINDEVRELNGGATGSGGGPAPGMLWFAQFIWSLPR